MNSKEFKDLETLPEFEYFKTLNDNKQEIAKKWEFWKEMEKLEKWNFEEEMKRYVFNKGQKLLDASVKLSQLTYDIQNVLRNNYDLAEKLVAFRFCMEVPNSHRFNLQFNVTLGYTKV